MAFPSCVAMRHPLLERRHRARGRLSLARRDGNEDDVLARATHAAIGRARAEDDLERMSTAVSNAGSLMDAMAAERDDIAAGVPTSGTLDAEAYVLAAQRQGECAVEVQNKTVAVDEEREKYERHRVENGARLRGTLGGLKPYGQKSVKVDGPTLLVLRDENVAKKAIAKARGPVFAQTTDEHEKLFGKQQSSDLAYKRNLRRRARQGIDTALPADVVSEFRADRGQLYGVQYNGLEPPPGEERELYETPEEAHAVATRWRKYWDTPRDAMRAAKVARGGVLNVAAHTRNEDLFCVKYSNKHRRKSRFVREPGTGGSWYYDWDAALKLKKDYEESNKDASWFVSQAEVNAADKEAKKRAAAKSAALSRKKAKP